MNQTKADLEYKVFIEKGSLRKVLITSFRGVLRYLSDRGKLTAKHYNPNFTYSLLIQQVFVVCQTIGGPSFQMV